MNKSYLTNTLALIITVAGYLLDHTILFSIGLFAVSGAITNTLAIHMLFEKVPGLYGSGVIPARFEDFKAGIRELMMKQFFTQENIDRFLSDTSGNASHFDFKPIIEKIDLSPSFDSLVQTIEESSFGGMLAMVGGSEALMPMREPFVEKMRHSIIEISQQDSFNELVRTELESPQVMQDVQEKIENIIEKRLNELTPQLVKEIIQEMIHKHLGWLVVWGGIFGGLIGFIAAVIQG